MFLCVVHMEKKKSFKSNRFYCLPLGNDCPRVAPSVVLSGPPTEMSQGVSECSEGSKLSRPLNRLWIYWLWPLVDFPVSGLFYTNQKVEIPPRKSSFFAFLESVLIIVSGLMRLLWSFV